MPVSRVWRGSRRVTCGVLVRRLCGRGLGPYMTIPRGRQNLSCRTRSQDSSDTLRHGGLASPDTQFIQLKKAYRHGRLSSRYCYEAVALPEQSDYLEGESGPPRSIPMIWLVMSARTLGRTVALLHEKVRVRNGHSVCCARGCVLAFTVLTFTTGTYQRLEAEMDQGVQESVMPG